ncbi:MAG: SPOR domain-containing protein [Bacteroidota bacterium]
MSGRHDSAILNRVRTMLAQRLKLLLLGGAILLSLQCSGGSQVSEDEEDQREPVRPQEYEESFRPGDYDPSLSEILEQLTDTEQPESDTTTTAVTILADTVQGFRVQVVSTSDIEEASYLRDSVSVFLPDDWVYVIYHTPYYKVRVGDFLSRIEANRMSLFLRKNGFSDAWIVPDRVLKPPPPKVFSPRIPRP